MADPAAQSSPSEPRRPGARGCLLDAALTLLLTVGLFIVIQTFVAQPYEVQQASMRATLEEGQFVLVDKLTPRFGGYSRGEIVVFNPIRREACAEPDGESLAGGTPYIKRVIGEPGDLVELRDGEVVVNGVALAEPYVGGLRTGPLSGDSSWVVPEDRLFVMGDNREDSVDSRSDLIGLICRNDVVGRAILRYWPLSRASLLPAPSYENSPAATPSTAPPSRSPSTLLPSRSPAALASPGVVDRLRVEIVERRPHDPTSYTQGLDLVGGRLFESSGLYGESTLREVDPETGAVLRSVDLDSSYFGEGIAVVDDRVIQLTWQEHVAFVYRRDDFSRIETFEYDTEGWGLCDDGTQLVMSDGTSRLYFRDRATFALIGTVDVAQAGTPAVGLNELECVDGAVYANVFGTFTIVRIDPATGNVTATIDASVLRDADGIIASEEAVLNGIAYDASTETFLLTGKLWPALFEARFVPN